MTSFSFKVKKVESNPYSELLNQEHSSLLQTCIQDNIPNRFAESFHYKRLKDFIKSRRNEIGTIIQELPIFASKQQAIAYSSPIIYNENPDITTESWPDFICRINYSVALEAYIKDKLSLKTEP